MQTEMRAIKLVDYFYQSQRDNLLGQHCRLCPHKNALPAYWQWSSGSEHCEWALLGGLIFPSEGGAPEYRTFLIPKSDYEIKDTWYSMGLKATGSQDIHVNDVFSPDQVPLPTVP